MQKEAIDSGASPCAARTTKRRWSIAGIFLLLALLSATSSEAASLNARFTWADGTALKGSVVLRKELAPDVYEQVAVVKLTEGSASASGNGWARASLVLDPLGIYTVDLYDPLGTKLFGARIPGETFGTRYLVRVTVRLVLYQSLRFKLLYVESTKYDFGTAGYVLP